MSARRSSENLRRNRRPGHASVKSVCARLNENSDRRNLRLKNSVRRKRSRRRTQSARQRWSDANGSGLRCYNGSVKNVQSRSK